MWSLSAVVELAFAGAWRLARDIGPSVAGGLARPNLVEKANHAREPLAAFRLRCNDAGKRGSARSAEKRACGNHVGEVKRRYAKRFRLLHQRRGADGEIGPYGFHRR